MKNNIDKNVILFTLTRLLISIFELYLSVNYGHIIFTVGFIEPIPAGFAIVILHAICIFMLDSTFSKSLNTISQFIIVILDILVTFALLRWSIIIAAYTMVIVCVFELFIIICHEHKDEHKDEDKDEDNDEDNDEDEIEDVEK